MNERIVASTKVGELLRVVRDSHEDCNNMNVATAWSKLAKVAGKGEGQRRTRSSNYIVSNTVQLLRLETPHVAGKMKPREVVMSMLWGIAQNENRFETDQDAPHQKTNLLKLLHPPTMHGLLRQKRMRCVGHTLRRADEQRPLKGGFEKRVGTKFKTMDKVPVGRHEGAQHQEHKSSGRHFQRKGNYSVQEVACAYTQN